MQADLHYQRVLLGKTLAAWKVGWNSLFEALVCMCCSVSVRAEELPCSFTGGTYTPHVQARMEALVCRAV